MARRSRDLLFMRIAKEFSSRSTCLRGQVGAVIVKNNHILSHGYNGAPPGQPECIEVGCDVLAVQTIPNPLGRPGLFDKDQSVLRPPEIEVLELGCQRAIHAEANAIYYAAKVGVNCDEARIYSTHEPCRKCAEAILACGIIEVYYDQPYRLGASDFLNQANILCENI